MRGVRPVGLLMVAVLAAGCASAAASVNQSPSEPRCTASQLRATYLHPPVAAAGQFVAAIRLDNAGPACRLFGYPGVSLLDGAGHQLGRPATRQVVAPAAMRPVSVGPGASAFIELRTERPDVATACTPPAAAIRLYPPDDPMSLEVRAAGLQACGGLLITGPLTGRSPFPAS